MTSEKIRDLIGCGTAASFNRDLLYHMGETLGNECQAEGVSVILGPAVNIKRSPLRCPVSFGGGVTMEDIQRLVNQLNRM